VGCCESALKEPDKTHQTIEKLKGTDKK